MKAEINRIKWKSRRGMRELDLLFENFFKFHADNISESELQTLRELLVYDDQSLFDFIFKGIKLGNSDHEDFIKKYLKKYEK
jgi:succinate dehydrogenase flavin-adding protein (antitoxin of CptAB toxin-antitoxin module)